MSRVIEFGNIRQREDGRLEFRDFRIDAEREAGTGPELLLRAVIRRLQEELATETVAVSIKRLRGGK